MSGSTSPPNGTAGCSPSAGAHFCLGANLARGEMEGALAFLAPRMPVLALDGTARLAGVAGSYRIEEMPLRWDAR